MGRNPYRWYGLLAESKRVVKKQGDVKQDPNQLQRQFANNLDRWLFIINPVHMCKLKQNYIIKLIVSQNKMLRAD